jgi:hypothetical protein
MDLTAHLSARRDLLFPLTLQPFGTSEVSIDSCQLFTHMRMARRHFGELPRSNLFAFSKGRASSMSAPA